MYTLYFIYLVDLSIDVKQITYQSYKSTFSISNVIHFSVKCDTLVKNVIL